MYKLTEKKKNKFQTNHINKLVMKQPLSPTFSVLNWLSARHPAGDQMAVTRNVNQFSLTACVTSASGAHRYLCEFHSPWFNSE